MSPVSEPGDGFTRPGVPIRGERENQAAVPIVIWAR